MSPFHSASVEEHNASISPSLSFASPSLKELPQWLTLSPEEPQKPDFPESQRTRTRTDPPSPPESCRDLEDSPDHNAWKPAPYLPTPPESPHSQTTEDLLDVPYPASPRPLSQCRLSPLTPRGRGRAPAFGAHGVPTPPSGPQLVPPTRSPDRYISNRSPLQDSYRIGKPPHLLSDAEKLLRRDSATPDPFITGSSRRPRRGRSQVSNSLNRSASRSQSRSVSNPDVLTVTHPSLASPQSRQASLGAVWNIGGGVPHPNGPVRAISDGQGGLIGSGTNAPLYTASFLVKDDSEEDKDTFSDRLAAALDIDTTRRVLDFSRPQPKARRVSGAKRERANIISRTQWKYGEWMREGDISCKQTQPPVGERSEHPE
ncbi:MAG: hypothetical protein Q9184_003306 [Pyrenodesmia sp. 2 TL-2023]